MGLVSTVHVHNIKDGHPGVFGPGDDVPEWAAAQMGVHCFEDEEHPFPDSDYPGKAAVSYEREPGAIPPKSGAGSSRDAWAAYANDVDVDVPADAQRDQIIEAIAAAGKPVEYSN